MNRIQLSAAVALLLLAGPLAGAQTRGWPRVELQDQFGNRVEPAALGGRIVILIGSDRTSRTHSRAWGRALDQWLSQAGDPDLAILRVADLRGVPPVLEGLVRQRLRRDRAVGILLDWDGELSDTYDFQPATTNVVVVDREGNAVRHLREGRADPSRVAELTGILDGLLQELRAQPSTEVSSETSVDLTERFGPFQFTGRSRP